MDKKLENKLYRKFKFLKKKLMPNIDCGDGWYEIIHNMCVKLDDIEKPDEFVITKIYDRYGDMDVHSKFGNNATRFAIEDFKDESTKICNACGNDKDLEKCDKCTVPVVDYSAQDDEESDDADHCACNDDGNCCGGNNNGGGCGCSP